MDANETATINYGLEVRYTLRAFTRALGTVAGSVDLSAAEFRLLRTLGDGASYTQAELASLAAMDRPYVSSLVKRMLGKGLLRTDGNSTDRRRVDITLSADGERALSALSRELADINEVAVDAISASELAVFTSVMARIRDNLERYAQIKSPSSSE